MATPNFKPSPHVSIPHNPAKVQRDLEIAFSFLSNLKNHGRIVFEIQGTEYGRVLTAVSDFVGTDVEALVREAETLLYCRTAARYIHVKQHENSVQVCVYRADSLAHGLLEIEDGCTCGQVGCAEFHVTD